MTGEEKKAIELLKKLQKKTPYIIWGDGTPYNKSNQIQTVLNLIEKQSKEIEHQKEKRENQKQELAILNAKQVEFNKLVNSYKGQFKKQQKEIEELKKQDLSNSKIIAKIDELEKEQEDNRNNLYNAVNNLDFKEIDKISNRIYVNMSTRDILQSLLEGGIK